MSNNRAEKRKRRKALFKEQNGRCYWCNEPMVLIDKPPPHLILARLCTLEHLRTRANAQRTEPSNGEKRLAAACQECNKRRGDGRCIQMKPFKEQAS